MLGSKFLGSRLSNQHYRNSFAASTKAPCYSRRLAIIRASSTEAADAAEPVVTLRFITPEAANQPIEVDCSSGEQLRACMLENKVDLYTTWGKIWSCGGAGQCGTCIVQIVEGGEILSERTATEDKKLSKKPETWRLACQTIVGDGTNTGTVVIQTKPQGK